MSKRFFVLDQNYFRNERLASLLDIDESNRFIIPDVALIEMCKSDFWERTLRESLTYLARYPTRCFVSIPVGVAVRYEIENRKSVDGNLIYREFTPILRSLLREIQSGVDSTTVELFRSAVESIRKELAQEDLNHRSNLKVLKGQVEVTRTSLGDDVIKSLRNGNFAREDMIMLVKANAPNLMNSFFREVGFPQNRIRRFLKQKPLVYRLVLLRFWLSLDWISRGGIDSIKETKATNDFLDQDYVLIASFFDDFLSQDDRANRAYGAIQSMLSD
jgi:hypothetical protein